MKQEVSKTDNISMSFCIGVLCFLLLTITVTVFTRTVLVKKLGMENAFTAFVFADKEFLDNGEEAASANANTINWAILYPFSENSSSNGEKNDDTPPFLLSLLDRYERTVESIENKLNTYSSSFLIGYQKLTEFAKAYDEVIGWNFASFGEYNGIVELPDDYLTSYMEECDEREQIQSLYSFNAFLNRMDIPLVYVQAPYKISAYDDATISGTADFSNQNADKLLNGLRKQGILTYDIRETIHDEKLSNHSLFYRTDHHWLTTTGLWASQQVLSFLDEKLDFHADVRRLDADKFRQDLYPDWFLGSQGKKVTLARTEPDDFVLLYPKYDTKFHYAVPAEDIDVVGDYSIVYDMRQIETKNLYGLNPYGGCNYGDQPLIRIENRKDSDDRKILIIHDSFCDCVISCLALCEKEVDSLDIRHFTGSVESYISENVPDVVIVMYNAGGVSGEIDCDSHTDMFDFR